MVFGPKMAIFPNFFLRHYRPGKCLLRCSQTKHTFLGYKNKKFKKSKSWHFSKGDNPLFLVQKWPFFPHFFILNIGQENVFYDILQWKSGFLGYKNKKFKTSKNWHFSKGDNPWFLVQKFPFFQHFFFRQYTQGKCLIRYFFNGNAPF